jgi:hypothetical protein
MKGCESHFSDPATAKGTAEVFSSQGRGRLHLCLQLAGPKSCPLRHPAPAGPFPWAFRPKCVQASVARTFGMSGKVADRASSAAKPGGSSRRHPRRSPGGHGRDRESVAWTLGRGEIVVPIRAGAVRKELLAPLPGWILAGLYPPDRFW